MARGAILKTRPRHFEQAMQELEIEDEPLQGVVPDVDYDPSAISEALATGSRTTDSEAEKQKANLSTWSRLRMDPTKTRWWVIFMILTVEFCERIAYYTLTGTEGTLLTTKFNLSPAAKSAMISARTQLSYEAPLIAGIIADTWLGNMWTAFGCGVLYIIGEVLVSVSVLKDHYRYALFLIGLFCFVVPGTGLKSVMMNFGAQQVVTGKKTSPAQVTLSRERFFQAWYASVMVGIIVSSTFMTSIATNGLGSLIHREDGFFAAYIIAAIAITIAVLVYSSSMPFTVHNSRRVKSLEERGGKPTPVVALLSSVWTERKKRRGKLALTGWIIGCIAIPWSFTTSVLGTNGPEFMSYFSAVLMAAHITCLTVAYFDCDWISNPDVGKFMQVIPVVVTGPSLMNISWSMMNDLFLAQTCQMDVRLFSDTSQKNGSFFVTFEGIGTLTFTVLWIFAIQPFFKSRGWNFPIKARFLLGGTFYMIGLGIATALEAARKHSGEASLDGKPIYSECANAVCPADMAESGCVPLSKISAWWMAIPYMFIGAGEVFINAGTADYLYARAPPYMRSIGQGIVLMASMSYSASIYGAVALITKGWMNNTNKQGVTGNLNDQHLEYVYIIAMCLGLVGLCYYAFAPVREIHAPSKFKSQFSFQL